MIDKFKMTTPMNQCQALTIHKLEIRVKLTAILHYRDLPWIYSLDWNKLWFAFGNFDASKKQNGLNSDFEQIHNFIRLRNRRGSKEQNSFTA
jgi:hypothetical protein